MISTSKYVHDSGSYVHDAGSRVSTSPLLVGVRVKCVGLQPVSSVVSVRKVDGTFESKTVLIVTDRGISVASDLFFYFKKMKPAVGNVVPFVPYMSVNKVKLSLRFVE